MPIILAFLIVSMKKHDDKWGFLYKDVNTL